MLPCLSKPSESEVIIGTKISTLLAILLLCTISFEFCPFSLSQFNIFLSVLSISLLIFGHVVDFVMVVRVCATCTKVGVFGCPGLEAGGSGCSYIN